MPETFDDDCMLQYFMKQVTINIIATFLYDGSVVIGTEWAYYVINFTGETQPLGSAETGSKHGELILFSSLFLVFQVSYLYSHHEDMT
jgi:hypothetical protein